jgi:alkylation response protein AidB-like acyl-CoA dehydrogenase
VNLNPTDEEATVADLLASVLDGECPLSRVRAAEPGGFDPALWQQLVGVGAVELAVPSDRGGSGISFAALGRAAEEYGRHLAPVPLVESVVAARVLARSQNTALDALLADCISGQVATVALADIGRRRVFLPAGAVARFVIGRVGQQVWCWDMSERPLDPIDNLASMPLAAVDAEAVASRPRVLVAEGVEAEDLLRLARAEWRLLTGHAVVGAGLRALSIGVDYTKERIQFERPIASFQAVQQRLADAATELRGAQLLCYKAAWLADEPGPAEPAQRLAALAFLCASREAFRAAAEALHFHGGYGFTLEYDIQLFFRRTKGWPLAHEPLSCAASDAATRVIHQIADRRPLDATARA